MNELTNMLALTYLLTGILVTAVAAWQYRHSARGKQRSPAFYGLLLFFAAGYGVTIFSVNLKMLVAGWEVMGLASFLLIAGRRNASADNILKAFFVYRLGDAGLLLAMWASQHLGHESNALISCLLMLTALAQASQLPFCSWLPQAVEHTHWAGEIVLVSLVAPMGTFLLLRTMPVWDDQLWIRMGLALFGAIGAGWAAGAGRVQTLWKRRVAYASIAQTGLIFLEVAAGFKTLALVHVAANALVTAWRLVLRTETGRDQSHLYKTTGSWVARLPKSWQYTLYLALMRDWGLYARLSRYLRPKHYL